MPAIDPLAKSQPLLIQLLIQGEILRPEQAQLVYEALSSEHGSLENVLVSNGMVTDQHIAETYADYLMLPLFDMVPAEPNPKLAELLPEKLCREHMIVPVEREDETLSVAFVTFDSLRLVDELQFLTGLTIQPMIAPLSIVDKTLESLFRAARTKFINFLDDSDSDDGSDPSSLADLLNEDTLDLDDAPPPGPDGRVIRLVNQIFEQSINAGASDIHLEPYEDSCGIRIRVDGELCELAPPAKSQFISIISRLKILAKMDIAEKRIPQDGAISLRTGSKRIDLRVSSVPTVEGEKIVMRILDKGSIPIELTGLGFDERQSRDLLESIQMPHGLMLVTGPTGSGKSTTLYACLNQLNKPGTNICTVEDPVEYRFKRINQIQVKSQVGLTFASALRSFLRQDPDVIMVGEVRDQETADICLRAALTGHFVLSTLHTNDSLSSVNRLIDMGIEPFLLASTLRVLEAQRLIRRLCEECKKPFDCDAETAKKYGLEPGQTIYRPAGCDSCRDTGYRGRVGVFEVVRITQEIANLIQTATPVNELRAAARADGMKLLLDSGMDKVRNGITSLEEVLAVASSKD